MSTHFSNVALVAKPDGQGVREPLDAIIRMLRSRGLTVRADERTAGFASEPLDAVFARDPLDALLEGADLAIAVGGDGTMLGVARVVARHSLRFEAARPLSTRLLAGPDWFVSAEVSQQTSNLAAFASRQSALFTGLRWTLQ